MKKKSFIRRILDGFATIGEGMASLFSLGGRSAKPFNYEERFGTDEQLLASDWEKVGDELRSAAVKLGKGMGMEEGGGEKKDEPIFNHPNCPKCGAPPKDHEVRNHDPIWLDGDVYCKKCGAYVRAFDAG